MKLIKNRTNKIKRLNSGFTLVELMITVSIVGILASFAIPSFNEMIANNRLSALSNDLITDLYTARSEAIKKNIPVTICSSTDQASCANSTNWGTGWIIFKDVGVPGVVDGVDEILFIHQPPNNRLTLTSDRAFGRFLPSGFST